MTSKVGGLGVSEARRLRRVADATSPNLREDARNRIKRLDVHPPEEEGGPPRIILEGNVPQMLRRAGVDTMKKGDAHGAAFLDRVIDSSVKRDPRVCMPLYRTSVHAT